MGKFSRGQTRAQMPGVMSLTVAACIHSTITSLITVLTAHATSAPQPPHTRAICQAPALGQVWTSYLLLACVSFYSHNSLLRKVLLCTPILQVKKPGLRAAKEPRQDPGPAPRSTGPCVLQLCSLVARPNSSLLPLYAVTSRAWNPSRPGLRFGLLLSSALALEARMRPSAASTINVWHVHFWWPRHGLRPEDRDVGDPKLKPALGSHPGTPGRQGPFPWGHRIVTSTEAPEQARGDPPFPGPKREAREHAARATWMRKARTAERSKAAAEDREDRGPRTEAASVCFLLICSGERGKMLPALLRGGALFQRLRDKRITVTIQSAGTRQPLVRVS